MIKKILMLCHIFFAPYLSAMEIAVHFTDAAQQKIDAGIDQFWHGTVNVNAFHVRFDVTTEDEEESIYCTFNCAHPYQDIHCNLAYFLKPKQTHQKIQILIPANLVQHDVKMTCESKTIQLIQTKLPAPKKLDVSQEKHDLTIDYTDELGFFILENM